MGRVKFRGRDMVWITFLDSNVVHKIGWPRKTSNSAKTGRAKIRNTPAWPI